MIAQQDLVLPDWVPVKDQSRATTRLIQALLVRSPAGRHSLPGGRGHAFFSVFAFEHVFPHSCRASPGFVTMQATTRRRRTSAVATRPSCNREVHSKNSYHGARFRRCRTFSRLVCIVPATKSARSGITFRPHPRF